MHTFRPRNLHHRSDRGTLHSLRIETPSSMGKLPQPPIRRALPRVLDQAIYGATRYVLCMLVLKEGEKALLLCWYGTSTHLQGVPHDILHSSKRASPIPSHRGLSLVALARPQPLRETTPAGSGARQAPGKQGGLKPPQGGPERHVRWLVQLPTSYCS